MRRIAPRDTSPKMPVKEFERECLWGQLAPVSPDRSRLLGVCDRCYHRHKTHQPQLLNHTNCHRRLDFRRTDP